MSLEKVYAKDALLAGIQQFKPGRDFNLKARDFTGAEQGVPIRIFGGTVKVAGTYITPIFGFRAEDKKTEGGK